MLNAPKFCSPDGPDDTKIVVLTDRPGWGDLNSGRFLDDHAGRCFWDAMRSAGILRSHVRVEALCHEDIQNRAHYELSREAKTAYETTTLERLSRLHPTLLITLGDWALEFATGLKSADKYHLSVLRNIDPNGPKVLSLLHPERVFKEHTSAFYLRLGASRALREARYPGIKQPDRNLIIRPTFDQTLSYLHRIERANWLSVDIETAYGHITCLGLGSAPSEAITIPTLPENWKSIDEWHAVWAAIARCLASPAKKVMQNGVYDTTYLASYGIRVNNFAHDTMVAQRILHPELPVGLDNIARIYTDEPYWKDEGKDHKNVKDWDSYYRYNAKDVCVTLAAAWAQQVDLKRRGLDGFFRHTMEYAAGPVLEMSWTGLPLDTVERERLTTAGEARVKGLEETLNTISQELLQRPTNPRSPAQVKALLAAAGFKRLPFIDGKETSNKGALMKLRLKKPDSKLLEALIENSEAQKEVSSYLRIDIDIERNVIPFTLYAAGTETMRSSCGKDPWNRGLNAQTIPSHLKTMIRVPEGEVLVEVDLAQADARVVAWDAAEPMLIKFFREKRDIHRYVASQPELFGGAESAITQEQRQLGKKVGHASNYGVGPATLVESCLKEMNLVITERKAEAMLGAYYRTFPGIKRWHERIKTELSRTRSLTAPTGYTRTFMGRLDQSMHREAYAHLPQHLVAYAINRLILKAYGQFRILLQIHDSGLFRIPLPLLDSFLALVKDQDSWNPTYNLSGGALRIPVEIKYGACWGEMKKIYEG